MTKYNIPVTLADGTIVTYLNSLLVQKQELDTEAVEKIKRLHILSHSICKEMEKAVENELPIWYYWWQQVQFALQRAWGFTEDANYHRFWEVPRCTCPELDNEDSYPTGRYVVDMNCPVHGNRFGVNESEVS